MFDIICLSPRLLNDSYLFVAQAEGPGIRALLAPWHRGMGRFSWPKVHPAPQARTINAAWARNGFRFEVSQCVWYFLSLAVRLLGCLVVCLVVWPFACLSVSLFPWLLVLCLLPFLFVCLFACLFVLLCIRNMRCVCMLM